MHILTKVFAVLAAVMSLVLASLTIMYSVNAETVRSSYDNARLNEQAAVQAFQTQQQLHSQETASLNTELQATQRTVADLQSQIGSLQIENDRLLREKRTAEVDSERVQGQVTQLGVAQETLSKIVDGYRDENKSLRDAELNFREQRLDLEDRIADQASQLQVLDATVRALREQLADAERRVEELRGGRTVASAESAGTVRIAGRPVRGRVESVQSDPTSGGTLVRVNIGSSDRMQANAVLSVFRGSTFVGEVTLTAVDLQASTGRVSLPVNGLSVQAGDEVITRFLE